MATPIPEAPASGAPGGKTSFMNLDSNVGGMACYISYYICCLGWILGIIFLITEKENRFVKFHALQSLFLFALLIVLGIILQILTVVLGLVLGMVNLGWTAGIFTWVFGVILIVLFVILVLIAGIKAYGGQWYKLPIIGNIAWNIVNK